MRLTGLISLRGGGRFIDVNKKEDTAVEYILKNYTSNKNLKTEKDFFNYIGEIDHSFIKTLSVFKAPAKTTKAELEK